MRQNNSFFVEQGKLKDSRLLFLSRYDYEKVRRQLSADSLLYPVFLKRDFYEVALPRKNEQIHITPQNAEFLYRILTRYENRKVEYDNGKIYENGKELTSCRLTQSYYWVIGDNRAGMSDSRSFGVLPHSHLIGKGVCIGYSRNPERPFWQSLRTDRFFKPNYEYSISIDRLFRSGILLRIIPPIRSDSHRTVVQLYETNLSEPLPHSRSERTIGTVCPYRQTRYD